VVQPDDLRALQGTQQHKTFKISEFGWP
jgi:hypothetical protein